MKNHKKLCGPGSPDINFRRKIPNFVGTFAQICGIRGERNYLGLSMYRNQCNPRYHFVIGNISIFPADSCINRIAPYVVEIEGKLFAVNGKAKLNRLLFSSTGTCALLWPLQDYSPSKISNITLSMHLTSECGYIKYHIVIPYVYH